MSVTNPAPTISNVVISARVGGFLFEYDKPTDIDFAGVKVYASTSSGFTPSSANLVADSIEQKISVSGLGENLTYYLRYTPYDLFGDGTTSSESSVTTIASVVSDTIDDPSTSDRQLAEDEYIVYADVIDSLRTGKYVLSGSASLTVTNPISWSSASYQQSKIAVFAYESKTLIPYSVDLSSTTFFRSWGIGQRLYSSGNDIAQYFSINDYVTFKADNGVESKIYKIREITDSSTAYVELLDAGTNTTSYSVQGDSASNQCRIYTNPTSIQSSIFSKVVWAREYAANSGEDFDLTGGWLINEITINESSQSNVLIMLWAPSMGCVPSVSTQGLDKATIRWQAQYKGQ